MSHGCLVSFILFGTVATVALAADDAVRFVARPATEPVNTLYVGNRAPLLPSPFVKLPIGAVEPRGWVLTQLQLMTNGYTGHLLELSEFLKKDKNAWLSPEGEGDHGWEEVPYWLRGYGDLGYVLGNPDIIKETRTWLDAALSSQRDDGYFGPRANLTSLKGNPDVWPHMIMLNALQSFHEYSGDERVLKLMTNFFRWELNVPEEDFLRPYWQHQRGADNLASAYWLYNRTGDAWLLDLAQKIHRRTANWTERVPDWHGVNIAQGFRGPAVYYVQSKDQKHLEATERDYAEVMGLYGQVPGGMFGADEHCRPGYTGPRQAAETCTMVEFMHSFETLLKITGDPLWADRCEEVAFNSLPAALSADLKALHYLTAPNLVRCDAQSKSPELENSGPMLLFDPRDHRCCQHNSAHGWPYFTEHLWLATPGNGLAAVLYAPCLVKAKVAAGTEVTIAESTSYPFEDQIEFKIAAAEDARFPLYLRVPGWCRVPEVKLNGTAQTVEVTPPGYIVLERTWTNGDTVHLRLPMNVTVKTWEKNDKSVSVSRGPLTYSLRMAEQWTRVGGTTEFAAWDVSSATPWNYGLVLDEKNPAASFEVEPHAWPQSGQPFEARSAPILLKAQARRIPVWKENDQGLIDPLQPSPAKSSEPVETVTLIPMGCARLRIAAFPTIGAGPDAHEWTVPKEPPVRASYIYNTLAALNDGILPKGSNDHDIPRFTWWDHRGTTEWVQYNFEKSRAVTGVEVYWFDDTGTGECRVPESWRVLYKRGEQWRPVSDASEYGAKRDQLNSVTFAPVEATALRLEVKLQKGLSGGILEWSVH